MAATPQTAAVPGEFNADWTLYSLDRPQTRLLRKAAAVGSAVIYLVYLIYRGVYTLNPDALVFSVAVYLAEIHGFFSLLFYYFHVWDLRGRHVPPPVAGMSVDVFITTYNEDLDLLRQTVRGAINMRYPHRTYVLDDGRREVVRALCDELGCDYITRSSNEHAKAGNWNNAFRHTTGALIVTFDADHVPRADFLERTVGFFADPRVALVQVPQRYHNLDSLQHRVDWRNRKLYGEQDVFFNLVMPGKDHWNAAFFCGTGAVLRRAALEPYGGLLTGTITEDMHTSIELQADGWKSVYLNELLVTGLAPMDFASYSVQRLRWAEGNLKIIKEINPLTCRGLTLPQRIAYFASMYHWTVGIPKLVFYLAPPIILFTGAFPIAQFDRPFVLLYLAHLFSMLGAYKFLSRGTGRVFMDELFNMANFFTLLVASLRLLVGRHASTFVVTSKRGGDAGQERAVLPHYVLIGFTILALTWSALGLGFGVAEDMVGAGVAAFWSLYNMVLMMAVVGFARRPVQKRGAVRFKTSLPVELLNTHTHGWLAVTQDLSETGCTLLWPGRVDKGTHLRLRLHLGPQTLDCDGEVMAVYGRHGGDWTRHGVRFRFDHPLDGDRVADAIYNMAVPEIFTRFSHDSLVAHAWREAVARLVALVRRRAPQESFLPLRVQTLQGEFLATTHDLGPQGLSLVSPEPLSEGQTVRVILRSPDGEWVSQADVVRSRPTTGAIAALQTWVVDLRIERETARRSLSHLVQGQEA